MRVAESVMAIVRHVEANNRNKIIGGGNLAVARVQIYDGNEEKGTNVGLLGGHPPRNKFEVSQITISISIDRPLQSQSMTV